MKIKIILKILGILLVSRINGDKKKLEKSFQLKILLVIKT